MPSYAYIRQQYGLSFEPDQIVGHTVTKRFGTVKRESRSQGHYVQVLFEGDRHALPCHPEELRVLDPAGIAFAF
jgi:hypothetical protein